MLCLFSIKATYLLVCPCTVSRTCVAHNTKSTMPNLTALPHMRGSDVTPDGPMTVSPGAWVWRIAGVEVCIVLL